MKGERNRQDAEDAKVLADGHCNCDGRRGTEGTGKQPALGRLIQHRFPPLFRKKFMKTEVIRFRQGYLRTATQRDREVRIREPEWGGRWPTQPALKLPKMNQFLPKCTNLYPIRAFFRKKL
jgi:hypothetical protein